MQMSASKGELKKFPKHIVGAIAVLRKWSSLHKFVELKMSFKFMQHGWLKL